VQIYTTGEPWTWIEKSQITFMKPLNLPLTVVEDHLSGRVVTDLDALPKYITFHFQSDNRIKVVGNSTISVFLTILTKDSLSVYPNIASPCELEATPNSIIIMNAKKPVQTVGADQVLWLGSLLEVADSGEVRQLLATFLLNLYRADLVIVVP
jgi:hypothetical protein